MAPTVLAQIVEEEAALSCSKTYKKTSNNTINNSTNTTMEQEGGGSGGGGSADIAVAAMALMVRLIVHWDHREVARYFAPTILPDGTTQGVDITSSSSSTTAATTLMPEVDKSSVCRAAKAAFSWKSSNHDDDVATARNGTKAPRAALDLLSAWTASDLDALDAASDACYAPTSSSSAKQQRSDGKHQQYRAVRHKLTVEDVRRMKPRQVAAHRKREGEYQRANTKRALRHVSAFCSVEVGGLDSMLACAARAEDHSLRREVGMQIGRMVSVFDEGRDDDVKKLICKALACTDWKVGKEEDNEDGGGISTLTIEELD